MRFGGKQSHSGAVLPVHHTSHEKNGGPICALPFGAAVPAAAIGVATAAGGVGGKHRQPFRQRDNAGQ
jgi:hypothetical protein